MVTRPSSKITCSKCGKAKKETEFFKMKTGSRCDLCRTCLTAHIDNRNPDTFLWILEKFDVPYIEHVWIPMCNSIYMKDPAKFGPSSVMGRYLRTMNMQQYINYGYADTEKLSLAYKQEQAQARVNKEEEEKLLQRFKNGEISQAEYLTLSRASLSDELAQQHVESLLPPIEPSSVGEDILAETEIGEDSQEEKLSFIAPVKTNENQIASQLTEEDIQYLAVKWGITYSPSEWVKMEDLYNKYASEYEMNVDRAETLKKICKISLKMDQALDVDDFQGFQKLSTTFDSLRKSGKFTEAQNKEEETRDLDSIGELVAFVEHEGGIIPQQNDPIDYPQDKIDFIIKDLQNYVTKLAKEDLGLGDLIESYIEKAENQTTDSVDDIMHKGFEEKEVSAEEEEIDMKTFADFFEEEIAQESLRLAEGDL